MYYHCNALLPAKNCESIIEDEGIMSQSLGKLLHQGL